MNILKATITSLILIISFMNSIGQKKKPNDTPTPSSEAILFQGYVIDKVNKIIGHYEYWEQDEPNGIHSWGESFVIDTAINFKTSCLYVMDNYIGFKEYYKPEHPIFIELFGESFDNQKFNCINDYIYEQNNTYYFLCIPHYNNENRYLREIIIEKGINAYNLTFVRTRSMLLYDDKGVYCVKNDEEFYPRFITTISNIGGLTYAGQDFFYNDKGLYRVKSDENGELRLITISKAKNCIPIVRKTYCEYNGEAFNLEDDTKRINADISKLYEIDVYRYGNNLFLTDGSTVYMPRYDIQVWEGGVEYSKMEVLSNGMTVYLADDGTVLNPPEYISVRNEERKIPGLSSWKQLSTGQGLIVENNSIDLTLSVEGSSDPLFFSPKEGFFTVDFSSPKTSFEKKAHYKKVIIYDYEKRAYEELDVNQFELHKIKYFFTYKGRLHYKGVPMENNIDGKKMKYLQAKWGADSNWLSDGNYLFHIYGRGETDFATVLVSNIKELKMVTDKLLVDNFNFYQFNSCEIEVIPIKSLGIEVKFDLSIYAWSENE